MALTVPHKSLLFAKPQSTRSACICFDSRQPILISTIRECLDGIYSNPGPYFDPALPKTEIVPCRYGSEATQVGAYYYYKMAKQK